MGNERIPKIIHYCWFGNKPLPQNIIKFINSWKEHCPDYEIIEWNEDNFDVNSNVYTREAYALAKWAFVSDYVRLKVLWDYGGIYMDTDVEVVKPLDEFLKLPAFSGFEGDNNIPTGIIGAEKNNLWIKNLLQEYDNRNFIKIDGTIDLTTNVSLITQKTKELYSIKLDNSFQELTDMTIFPYEWFCSKSIFTGRITRTVNTYTIHHFSGSWMTKSQKFKLRLTGVIGKPVMIKLSKMKQLLLKVKKK
ncbi:glycosyltransferase family 32 protein [Cohnella sp. 56]|uniref:glycosyltransferase family 32 protein n=1 Tax=Cohnella sp. 56 TaxID=3113722 RepID=UPI0030E790A0